MFHEVSMIATTLFRKWQQSRILHLMLMILIPEIFNVIKCFQIILWNSRIFCTSTVEYVQQQTITSEKSPISAKPFPSSQLNSVYLWLKILKKYKFFTFVFYFPEFREFSKFDHWAKSKNTRKRVETKTRISFITCGLLSTITISSLIAYKL